MIKIIWGKITKSKENVLKGGMILFLGMSLFNFGNYLFNLVIGRMLGPADYGALISLISLLAIISVPAATIQTAATKFSANFQANKETPKINFLIRYLTKKIVLIGIVSALILLAASPFLKNFLNLNSSSPVIILALASFFLFLVPINRGVIQGIQDFKGLSINMGAEPILKITIALALVFLGFKINGAVFAILLTTATVYFLSFYPLKDIIKNRVESFKTNDFWSYSLPTLAGIFLINLLIYSDVILVKHFLPPTEAGLYSGLSTISKIVLYFSFPFVYAMFPKISNLFAREEKHFPVLAQTFIIVSVLSLLAMGFFILLPQFSIKILFGNQYLSASPYLGSLAFAMFLLALDNVFVNYYLSISQKRFIIPLVFFAFLEIILIVLFHNNFQQIINNLILSFGGLLLSLSGFYLYSKKQQIAYAINNIASVK